MSETVKLGDPHPHWDAKNKDYPKTVEEWDPRKDPVGHHLELAEKRLRVSIDRDDPRAPDEMALVSRWDLMTLIHDWWHKSAVFDIWRAERAGKVTAQPVAWSTPIKIGRQLTSFKEVADRWRDSGLIVEELYVACPPHLPGEPQIPTWQQIETAPKDGSRILATGGGLAETVEVVTYNERVGCWSSETCTLDDTDHEPQGYNRPTHWQPMPDTYQLSRPHRGSAE